MFMKHDVYYHNEFFIIIMRYHNDFGIKVYQYTDNFYPYNVCTPATQHWFVIQGHK